MSKLPKANLERDYLTIPQAAEKLGMSRWTLHRHLEALSPGRPKIKVLKDEVSRRMRIKKTSMPALKQRIYGNLSL